jgi:peptide methionine sulfoxide reductase msrA/msrB
MKTNPSPCPLRHHAFMLLCACLAACSGGESQLALPAQAGTTDSGGAADTIVLGMGCFWGAEKRMVSLPGIVAVEVGYANGEGDARYESILAREQALRAGNASERNYAEVVRVRFDPARVSLEQVLARFWESHDPTQGNRQGNDVGSNYRSAIYTADDVQQEVALHSRDIYQLALSARGFGRITTEIGPLHNYRRAEEYHQEYLVKNLDGYCGLSGIGVPYPSGAAVAAARPGSGVAGVEGAATAASPEAERVAPLDGGKLDFKRQLVVFEGADCAYCRKFEAEVLAHWRSPVAVATTLSIEAPRGWSLEKPLFATPTMVLFEKGREVARYTGYNGEQARFWQWLGFRLLTPEQRQIAFERGTEPAYSGSNLDEKRPGTFVDPITGAPLFRSNAKFESGTGWPSFFDPLPGAITLHADDSLGMRRIEVRSASSGIHLGHVFDDGPPPTHKRYCINGNVLKFVPD